MSEKLTPVTLTKQAVREINNIMQKKSIPREYALRVGIKGSGGCGGFDYLLGFDKKKENDLIYEVEGISILIEKKHTMYLLGLKVDYLQSEDGRGFTFLKDDE